MLLEPTSRLISVSNILIQGPHHYLCSDHSNKKISYLVSLTHFLSPIATQPKWSIHLTQKFLYFLFLPLESINLEMLILYLKCSDGSSCHFPQLASHPILNLHGSIWSFLKLLQVLYRFFL